MSQPWIPTGSPAPPDQGRTRTPHHSEARAAMSPSTLRSPVPTRRESYYALAAELRDTQRDHVTGTAAHTALGVRIDAVLAALWKLGPEEPKTSV